MGFELLIKMDDKGNINVAGPLKDKTLCWGMLIGAVFALYEYKESKVIPAKFVPPIPAGGGARG